MALIVSHRVLAQTPLEATAQLIQKRAMPEDSGKLLSPRALNLYFARQTAALLSTTTDLSLNNAYALLDDKDGRLFAGGSIGFRKSEESRMWGALTLGAKANVKDGFSKLSSEGKFQNDIGASIKFTLVGRGTISYAKEDSIHKLKVRKFVEAEAMMRAQDLMEWGEKNYKAHDDDEERSAAYKKQQGKVEKELLAATVDEVESQPWYTRSRMTWLSAEVYVPLTRSEYLIADSATALEARKEMYKPWTASLTYTWLWKYPKLGLFFVTGSAGLERNNSVLAEDIEDLKFQSSTVRSDGDTLLLANFEDEDVYVGEFKQFWTPTASITGSWMIGNLPFGVSGSIERMFGDVEAWNWKLGVPVSLRGKDGKRSVNFELQWRERFNGHTVGVSVGLPFGDFL